MLNFFRKYQKFFFVVVTFFIVVSFSFFGAFSTFTNTDKKSDREIGKLIDGSSLKEQKLFGLIRLLQNGIEEGSRIPNLLNGSFIHKEIMKSGLGEMLALHYFDELKPELEIRWRRIKNFSPYVHPYAPFISAKAIWSQFAPQINSLLDEVKRAPETLGEAELGLMFRLYAAQGEFPAPLLHQMLYYQQSRSDQIRPDLGLPGANVSLFGFNSVEDWLGAPFVEKTAKFILNGACLAKKEGYSVKNEEALADMLENVSQGVKLYMQGKAPAPEDVRQAYLVQLQQRGLEETQAVSLWKEALQFKRLFEEVGQAAFLDRLSFDHFKSFASPTRKICRYTLPASLQFHSFRDMLKFQRYLEAVAEGDLTGLPQKMKKEIEKDLLYQSFEVELASLSKAEVLSKISLKQTWGWEVEEKNFAKLQASFPALLGKGKNGTEERLAALEGLNDAMRAKVDQMAREELLKAHPEWIAEQLAQVKKVKQTLKVRLQGGEGPFSGEAFLKMCENQDPALALYSPDQQTFYAISIVGKEEERGVLSFEEAQRDDTLDRLLDETLLEAYKASKYKAPLDEVKDEVACRHFAALLKSIRDQAAIAQNDDYALHRFDGYLKNRRLSLMEKRGGEGAEGLWPLQVREESLLRDSFNLKIGEFSPVDKGQFYELKEISEAIASESELAMTRDHLKRDAQKSYMQKLLKKL